VSFRADDRRPPFETVNIIDAVADHVNQRQFVECKTPLHLPSEWL